MVLAQKWWVPPLRKVIADLQRGAPMRSQTSSAGRRDDARPWKSKVRRGAGSDLLVAGGNKPRQRRRSLESAALDDCDEAEATPWSVASAAPCSLLHFS